MCGFIFVLFFFYHILIIVHKIPKNKAPYYLQNYIVPKRPPIKRAKKNQPKANDKSSCKTQRENSLRGVVHQLTIKQKC